MVVDGVEVLQYKNCEKTLKYFGGTTNMQDCNEEEGSVLVSRIIASTREVIYGLPFLFSLCPSMSDTLMDSLMP